MLSEFEGHTYYKSVISYFCIKSQQFLSKNPLVVSTRCSDEYYAIPLSRRQTVRSIRNVRLCCARAGNSYLTVEFRSKHLIFEQCV